MFESKRSLTKLLESSQQIVQNVVLSLEHLKLERQEEMLKLLMTISLQNEGDCGGVVADAWLYLIDNKVKEK